MIAQCQREGGWTLSPRPSPKAGGEPECAPKATAVAAVPLPCEERWQGRGSVPARRVEGYERLPNEQRKHHQATAHVRRNNTSSRFGMRREAPLLARFLAMSVIPA